MMDDPSRQKLVAQICEQSPCSRPVLLNHPAGQRDRCFYRAGIADVMLQRLLGALFHILRLQQSFRGQRLDVLPVVLRKPGKLRNGEIEKGKRGKEKGRKKWTLPFISGRRGWPKMTSRGNWNSCGATPKKACPAVQRNSSGN